MGIEQVVNVNITRQTGAVSKTGFGTPLVLDTHYRFSERIRYYSNADAVLDDGFVSTEAGYLAALAAFRASPSPGLVAIGRRKVDDVDVTVTDAIDATEYRIDINGTPFTYTATVPTDTETDIAAALVIAITAGSEPVTASNVGAVITIVATGDGFGLSVADSTGGISETGETVTETWPDARVAVSNENDDWYMIGATTRVQAEQIALAANIEATRKFFVVGSNESDIINVAPASDTTSLAALVKAAGYARTSVLYSAQADGSAADTWPEMTWIGRLATVDPDVQTATWNFKSLPGVTVDNLTDTQVLNVVGDQQAGSGGKNANVYIELGGSGATQNGKVGEGEWADIINGVDWLTARMTENILSVLLNNDKVPYTNAGIALLVAEVRAQLKRGINTNFLAFDEALDPNFGFLVEFPDVSAISATDKANRILKNITFAATVAGAIHAVQVTGTVSV